MATYRGNADRKDRARAVTAVAAVHALLAAVIIAGLNVPTVRHAIDRLTTFSLSEPPPSKLPPPPKPQPRSAAAKREGAPAPRANATPVVAPAAKIPAPSQVLAAAAAGTGAASASGAAASGNGSGAEGSGNGAGSGGSGPDYFRFTPARLIANIPSSQYGRLAATGVPSGLVGVRILVGPDGFPQSCNIARSSGDPSLDGLVCQLTRQYVRFAPALDDHGRPVAQEVTYFPNWRRR